jgi:hypothetical protein
MIRMSHPAPVLDWWITLERKEFWYLADIVALSQIILHKSAPLSLMVWAPFLSQTRRRKKFEMAKIKKRKAFVSYFWFFPPSLPKNGYFLFDEALFFLSIRNFLFYFPFLFAILFLFSIPHLVELKIGPPFI